MDYGTKIAELEEIIKRYRMHLHRGNVPASMETLDEWRQATYAAFERFHADGFETGYEVGQNGEVSDND